MGSLSSLNRAKKTPMSLAVSTKWWLIGSATAGLTLAIGLICTITIFGGLVRPLSATTGAMNGLANGNLNVDVSGAERKDEVGLRALQAFKDNAIEARGIAAAQDAENQAKMRRAEVLDQLTKRFEMNVEP